MTIQENTFGQAEIYKLEGIDADLSVSSARRTTGKYCFNLEARNMDCLVDVPMTREEITALRDALSEELALLEKLGRV